MRHTSGIPARGLQPVHCGFTPRPMRCDVHIVARPDRYPQVAARTCLAGVASLDTLRDLDAPATMCVVVSRFAPYSVT